MTAHNGIVRCGLCSAIFNATEHLHDDEPSPQLKLPIIHPENELLQFDDVTEAPQTEEASSSLNPSPPPTPDPTPTPAVTGSEELETLFQQIEATNTSDVPEDAPRPKKQRGWLWATGSILFILLGIAQAIYFYRVDVAARLPGLKPALLSYCELLKCVIPLPQRAELMSIESSDLVADPLQPSIINLSALLHNRAEYVLAFPNVELSLTDIQDRILARRVFIPAEYLKPGEEEKRGLASNRETSIQLHLDTADLKPAGYKLLLFYPQP
jgi:hypothetical protein